MSLESVYEIVRKIDQQVDEIYKLRDSFEKEILKKVSSLRENVKNEVENVIKQLVEERRKELEKIIEEEASKYKGSLMSKLNDFKTRVEASIDKVVEEVLKMLGIT